MRECEIKREGERVIASIKCEIDHHTAKGIREAIDREICENGVKILTIDFSSVTFMDSSGIGLIIGRASKAEKSGARVEVMGLCRSLRKIVCMSGIERIPNVNIT